MAIERPRAQRGPDSWEERYGDQFKVFPVETQGLIPVFKAEASLWDGSSLPEIGTSVGSMVVFYDSATNLPVVQISADYNVVLSRRRGGKRRDYWSWHLTRFTNKKARLLNPITCEVHDQVIKQTISTWNTDRVWRRKSRKDLKVQVFAVSNTGGGNEIIHDWPLLESEFKNSEINSSQPVTVPEKWIEETRMYFVGIGKAMIGYVREDGILVFKEKLSSLILPADIMIPQFFTDLATLEF